MRRMTVVGSRLELSRRVTSDSRERRSRAASAARRASRSCSNTCARSSAWAVSAASVARKRTSGPLSSGLSTKASDSTPEGSHRAHQRLGDDGDRPGHLLHHPRHDLLSRSRPRARRGRRWSSPRCDRGRRQTPARVVSMGIMALESRAGCPLLARQARPRSPTAGTRTMADCAPRARRPPAMAAWATSPGVVAAARAELSWCRCWLRSRLTNSVRVRRARSTACAAVPVMVRRKDRSGPGDLSVLGPMDDDDADGVIGDDHGDDGQGAEPARFDGGQDVGALVFELVE